VTTTKHPGQRDEFLVSDDEAGQRLDVLLSQRFAGFSRAHLKRLIDSTSVLVNGRTCKASHHLRAGEQVQIVWSEPLHEGPQPEPIALAVIFEDECLIAINKPPGMVVHPSKGHWSGTLAAALRHHFDQLSSVGGPTRPGIVHRLDRDTSGVIVVAKTDQAHFHLARQFESRTVEKEYFALVRGRPDRDRDQVELPIGHHPHQREKMAAGRDDPSSRPARTFYEVAERFDGFAAVRCRPKTGRTHQIRVHLASIGCPVLCDRLYGGQAQLTLSEVARTTVEADRVLLDRQALHAERLRLTHPESGMPREFAAPLPSDMSATLQELRTHRAWRTTANAPSRTAPKSHSVAGGQAEHEKDQP
jgi:23S rRNA pseudouridine1911/1915/1917 synthase